MACMWSGFLAAVMACTCAFGQLHQGDIRLTVASDRIVTNDVIRTSRVFAATLGTDFPDFTADPGFDCAPGTLPSGSRVGFRLHGALTRWTGAGLDGAIDERMAVEFAGVLSSLTPTDSSVVTGFTLSVGSNGQWHRHLEYTLQPPAATGVYVLAMSLYSTNASVGESDVFWIVFNQNAPVAEIDAAAQWIDANLIGSPGCPSDWDGSGGVDGDDVIAFFGNWDANQADFNGDGGTDGDDVIAFFTAWDAGC